jgi:hypothetical protein
MEQSTTQELTGCVATLYFPSILWNPEGSLLYSKELSTFQYPEPDHSM